MTGILITTGPRPFPTTHRPHRRTCAPSRRFQHRHGGLGRTVGRGGEFRTGRCGDEQHRFAGPVVAAVGPAGVEVTEEVVERSAVNGGMVDALHDRVHYTGRKSRLGGERAGLRHRSALPRVSESTRPCAVGEDRIAGTGEGVERAM
ncbi:hypothetical protein [Saccharothrix obliqua]|uniref:hypothetical protein n=1 Tax=Saccharothrix obliqua TaxID=2861747 RepID=UPI001C5E11FF|nr:hypothetical protein [Saccharothrix obliqua]MBW4722306.1 hypothetical protein [Saccharothrix obliqua]